MYVSQEKKDTTLKKLKEHIKRHARYATEQRSDATILMEYYTAVGMLEALYELDIVDNNLIKSAWKELYKPYETK